MLILEIENIKFPTKFGGYEGLTEQRMTKEMSDKELEDVIVNDVINSYIVWVGKEYIHLLYKVREDFINAYIDDNTIIEIPIKGTKNWSKGSMMILLDGTPIKDAIKSGLLTEENIRNGVKYYMKFRNIDFNYIRKNIRIKTQKKFIKKVSWNCQNCGTEVPDGIMYCDECARKLFGDEEEQYHGVIGHKYE
jgi:hypothetical protein